MPFQIVRNDITNMHCDAIVNTANPRPVIGSGTDAGIHAKAGPELLEARKAIGAIRPGHAAITPAFHLGARYVIHTVGPVWRGGLFGEAKTLRSCYDSALALAQEHHCKSIAFPLISTGNYGFPRDRALSIAIQACSDFLLENEMDIYLVVFDRKSFCLSGKLLSCVTSYIDEHYVETVRHSEYACTEYSRTTYSSRRRDEIRDACHELLPTACYPSVSAPAPKAKPSLKELLDRTDAGFSETLLKLIDRTDKKDSVIYNRANISRQHFSKIRNNPAYQPTKSTALAFAIALELNLAETRDLIGRAGFALTNSSKFDVIIMYFIEQGNYNIHDINAVLFEFDQSLLGA